MFRTALSALAIITLIAATPAQAEVKKLLFFSISNKTSKVTGSYNVGGYSPNQMLKIMSKECKGQVGSLEPVKKARKRRGVLHQKFQGVCQGGLAPRYKGSRATFSVSAHSSGKNRIEITTSDGSGNVLFLREIR